jgi:hypothetical protein
MTSTFIAGNLHHEPAKNTKQKGKAESENRETRKRKRIVEATFRRFPKERAAMPPRIRTGCPMFIYG